MLRDFLLLVMTIFWSLTYVFAILHSIKFKRHAIPAFAISLNFAWELVAAFMSGEYISITWLLLDVAIVVLLIIEFINEKNIKSLFYIVSCAAYGILCYYMFTMTFTGGITGFVFLSFTMDLAMAINYIVDFKGVKNSNVLLILVAVFKLLGDFFAMVIYREYIIVMIEGIAVLLLNIVYLAMVTRLYVFQKSHNDMTNRKTSE